MELQAHDVKVPGNEFLVVLEQSQERRRDDAKYAKAKGALAVDGLVTMDTVEM